VHNNIDHFRNVLLSEWILFVICWPLGLSILLRFRSAERVEGRNLCHFSGPAERFAIGHQVTYLYIHFFTFSSSGIFLACAFCFLQIVPTFSKICLVALETKHVFGHDLPFIFSLMIVQRMRVALVCNFLLLV
jgi:hypothetical protein